MRTVAPIEERLWQIRQTFRRDAQRERSHLTPSQISTLKRARTERIRNHTYERQRELRGELTSRLRKRMLQGPPAPVVAQWGEKERLEDRTVRGGGWGGYAGEVKERRGMTGGGGWSEERWESERARLGLVPGVLVRPTVPGEEKQDAEG